MDTTERNDHDKMADDKVKKLPWGLKPESLKPSSMKVIFEPKNDRNSLLILFYQCFISHPNKLRETLEEKEWPRFWGLFAGAYNTKSKTWPNLQPSQTLESEHM